MAQTTLADLLNKRPAQKIEKLYPGSTTKPVADLTVTDLNNIGLHIMLENSATGIAPSHVYIPGEALRIIGMWAQDQKKPIL